MQFAMPETYENCSGIVCNRVYCVSHTHEIYRALPFSLDFKASGELLNQLSKTVLIKCSFDRKKVTVNILNDHKAQKWLVRRICEYFSYFWHRIEMKIHIRHLTPTTV